MGLFALVLACLALTQALVLRLEGNYSQTYFWYASIRVGGSLFTVAVDTGSSDLLVPALGCGSCFGGDPRRYYNVSGHLVRCPLAPNSSLACVCSADAACDFSVTYGGTLTEYAHAVHDSVSLGPGWSGGVDFGATYKVTSTQTPQSGRRSRMQRRRHWQTRQGASEFPEGLWGLAFDQLNSLGAPTLLTALAAKTGHANVATLCLQEVGGALVVGETPKWGAWQWVPVTKRGFWQVGFEDVTVGGVSLGPSSIFNTPGIVDSGTPFFTLQAKAFEKLEATLLGNCSRNWLKGVCGLPKNATVFDGACFKLSPADIAQYPSIVVDFVGGTKLELRPDMLLIPMFQCSEPGTVSLAVVSDPSFTVISGSVLLHYASSYDADNMRVGFLPSSSNCSQFLNF